MYTHSRHVHPAWELPMAPTHPVFRLIINWGWRIRSTIGNQKLCLNFCPTTISAGDEKTGSVLCISFFMLKQEMLWELILKIYLIHIKYYVLWKAPEQDHVWRFRQKARKMRQMGCGSKYQFEFRHVVLAFLAIKDGEEWNHFCAGLSRKYVRSW